MSVQWNTLESKSFCIKFQIKRKNWKLYESVWFIWIVDNLKINFALRSQPCTKIWLKRLAIGFNLFCLNLMVLKSIFVHKIKLETWGHCATEDYWKISLDWIAVEVEMSTCPTTISGSFYGIGIGFSQLYRSANKPLQVRTEVVLTLFYFLWIEVHQLAEFPAVAYSLQLKSTINRRGWKIL